MSAALLGPVTPVLEKDSSGNSLEAKVCHPFFAEVDEFRYFYSRNLSEVIFGVSPKDSDCVNFFFFFFWQLISPQILSAMS